MPAEVTSRPIRAGTRLERILAAGSFAVTAEIAPPASADGSEIRRHAAVYRGTVDACNVTDGQRALVRISSLAAATIALQEGVEPIMQMVSRDHLHDRLDALLQGDRRGGQGGNPDERALAIGHVARIHGPAIDGRVAADLRAVRGRWRGNLRGHPERPRGEDPLETTARANRTARDLRGHRARECRRSYLSFGGWHEEISITIRTGRRVRGRGSSDRIRVRGFPTMACGAARTRSSSG